MEAVVTPLIRAVLRSTVVVGVMGACLGLQAQSAPPRPVTRWAADVSREAWWT
jgi:hypothetical protein